MASKIGPEHGVEGTRKRLQALDPQATDVPAFNRLFGPPGAIFPGDSNPVEGTLLKLVANSNELMDRVAVLEAKLKNIPFPFNG